VEITPVLPIAGQIFQPYFEGYLEFLAVLQSSYFFSPPFLAKPWFGNIALDPLSRHLARILTGYQPTWLRYFRGYIQIKPQPFAFQIVSRPLFIEQPTIWRYWVNLQELWSSIILWTTFTNNPLVSRSWPGQLLKQMEDKDEWEHKESIWDGKQSVCWSQWNVSHKNKYMFYHLYYSAASPHPTAASH
jgi:hypothetical protein